MFHNTLTERCMIYVIQRLEIAMSRHLARTEYRRSAPWGVS